MPDPIPPETRIVPRSPGSASGLPLVVPENPFKPRTLELGGMREYAEALFLDFDLRIQQFLDTHDAMPRTLAVYRAALKRFKRFLEEEGVQAPAPEHVLRYKARLLQDGLAPKTRKSYLGALALFFRTLKERDAYFDIVAQSGVRQDSKAETVRKKRPLTTEEVQRLMGHFCRGNLSGDRDYALARLMLVCGLRAQEVAYAKVIDLKASVQRANTDKRTPHLLYVIGKGHTEADRFVVVPPRTVDDILLYLKHRPKHKPESPLFAGTTSQSLEKSLTAHAVSMVIRNALRAVGILDNAVTPHSLRHTLATVALEQGTPLSLIQEAMRHERADTTLIYAKRRDRVEKAPEVVVEDVLFKDEG